MADAALVYMLDNFMNQLMSLIRLIGGAYKEADELNKDIRLLQSHLKDYKKKGGNDESRQELVRQIREIIYEAEDVFDGFLTLQNAQSKSSNWFFKITKEPVKLLTVANAIRDVRSKVDQLYKRKNKVDVAKSVEPDRDPGEHYENLRCGKVNVVGFEEDTKKIIENLREETDRLDVISITGMPGIGKTTLAWKIFDHTIVKKKFPTRIWVSATQNLRKREVFLSILRELTTKKMSEKKMSEKSDWELAQLVAAKLPRTEDFLIVIDGVWTTEDWDKVRLALPENNNKGRVLITSRNEVVARYANCDRPSHKLGFLNQADSWLLLQHKVFRKAKCSPELEIYGNQIADKCGGLPHAIVVIGNILAKKYSPSNEEAAISEWKNVSGSIGEKIYGDSEKCLEKSIALSYDRLPDHLRECFLYLGMFPENFEIPVPKLIWMWIAEGFIYQNAQESLEQMAESYLDELIDSNLVIKIEPDGKIEMCRIHGMVRGFCRTVAGNERDNFLQELIESREGDFHPSASNLQKNRRLYIHSNHISKFFSSKRHGPRVRSFVCFPEKEVPALTPNDVSAIPTAFNLLRVLDVKPIIITKIPKDMYHLVHLKYVVLSFNLNILPAAFSKLRNIQTLIVDTTSPTLEIKADIWKMSLLRHLQTNASTNLPKADKTSKGMNLQTLGTISPQSCTQEVFDRTPNLTKLGISGKLVSFLDGKDGQIHSLEKLSKLEKLKLLNDVSLSQGQFYRLPSVYKFPPNMRSLTLSATLLDWSNMSVLGLLVNLEELELINKAFMGENWTVDSKGFLRLQVLHIGSTDLATLTATGPVFRSLRRLELHNCLKLNFIAKQLGDIPTLQLLELKNSTFAAINAAKEIEKARSQKQQEDQTNNLSLFKLTIFPQE